MPSLMASLIALIVLLVRGSRNTAKFADFSISISPVGRETAYVQYWEGDKLVDFPAELGQGKNWKSSKIWVRMPEQLDDAELRRLVPKLAAGLKKLRYEYLIYRRQRPPEVDEKSRSFEEKTEVLADSNFPEL